MGMSRKPMPRGGRREGAPGGDAPFLQMAAEAVSSIPPPWKHATGKVGRSPLPPRAMVLCAMLRQEKGMSWRGLESHLRENPDLLGLIGLEKAPPKSSMQKYAARVMPRYARRLNGAVEGTLKGKRWCGPRVGGRGARADGRSRGP